MKRQEYYYEIEGGLAKCDNAEFIIFAKESEARDFIDSLMDDEAYIVIRVGDTIIIPELRLCIQILSIPAMVALKESIKRGKNE